MDTALMQTLVQAQHGIALEPAAAERLAGLQRSLARSFGAVASGSLFDTEPAQFVACMESLAKAVP